MRGHLLFLALIVATPSHAEDWLKRGSEQDGILKDFHSQFADGIDGPG